MSSFTIQKVGQYSYLHISVSKWDPIKKISINKKTKIGKLDLITGEPIFTENFLNELHESPELKEKILKRFPTADLSNINTIKRKPFGMYPGANLSFGKTYFSYYIAESIGLLKILKESFPYTWQKIFTIASFLLFEDKSIMDCDDFVVDNLTFKVGTLSSQRTSELLFKINERETHDFFNAWYKIIREKEYIAFDSTSIPSYSENNEIAEYGKAKSNPDLKQVNLCLLCGEQSKLPVYQAVYEGSINDVSIFLDIIKQFEVIVGTSDILIVNDKGFFSKKNVLDIVNKTDVKFLLAVPFSNKPSIDIVNELTGSDLLKSPSSLINTNHESIRGITQIRTWFKSHQFYTHILYDGIKHHQEETSLIEDLKDIKDSYLNGKLSINQQNKFNKYFIINKKVPKNSREYIIDNFEAIQQYLSHKGWLILISNHVTDAQEAYDLYINKDCIEKAFEQYKQNLNLQRFYTSNTKRITNKAFVAFIALILNSHVHRIMTNKNLYRKYTRNRMFSQINRMNVFLDTDGKYYIHTLTKSQKDILEAFDLPIPNRNRINYFIKVILK
jgi:transposase